MTDKDARQASRFILKLHTMYSDLCYKWQGEMRRETFERVDRIFIRWDRGAVQRVLAAAMEKRPDVLAAYAHALKMPYKPDKFSYVIHLYDLNAILHQIEKSLRAA